MELSTQRGPRGGLSPAERREQGIVNMRVHRENNRELLRQKQREYRQRHKEECAVRNKAWAIANPEKIREYHRKSRKNNPEGYREITRRYRNSHPEMSAHFNKTSRARRRGAFGNMKQDEWDRIIACFAGHCACCGSQDHISLDHIVPVVMGGTHTIDNAQPLCISCNSRKHTQTIDYRPLSPWFNRDLYKIYFQ